MTIAVLDAGAIGMTLWLLTVSIYKETKYNLDYLEIGHMTKEQLRDYLYSGKYTPKA